MYAKLINNRLEYAPRNYVTGENLILNFNKNVTLMKKYGFKEVIDIKPEYDNSTHYLSIENYIEDENTITINYKLNEIEIDNTPSLKDRVVELERINKEQDEIINISLLATDEMFTMLEPLLGEAITLKMTDNLLNMYVTMVRRKIKNIEEVPVKYREQVREIIHN